VERARKYYYERVFDRGRDFERHDGGLLENLRLLGRSGFW
jgi:hypothetical protein